MQRKNRRPLLNDTDELIEISWLFSQYEKLRTDEEYIEFKNRFRESVPRHLRSSVSERLRKIGLEF